jgi:ADP-ribose pyrophosphatase
MAEPTEPTGRRSVFEGSVIRVEIEEWPGLPPHEVIHHLGAAGVLPLLPSNEVLLVKQFRPAVRQTLTEIPAGQLDVEGEDALTCASRELFEETGYRHRAIEFLGGFYSSPGFTDEYVHLFWARTEAEPVGEPEQGIAVVRMPFARMVEAARAGRVRDVKTAVALLIAAELAPLP